MGAILNKIPVDKIDALGRITPDRADWLTSHADASGLSIVEVERLWYRFRQITGSNNKTRFYPQNTALPDELSTDSFVINMLKHFPRLKTDDNAIPFGYFIAVLQWLDRANLDQKLEAIFLYLNNGEPIDAPFLTTVFVHMYPEMSDEELIKISVEAMEELGSTEKGKLNQKEFVEAVERFMPRAQLENILQFRIIPFQVIHETNLLPPLPLPPLESHKHSLPAHSHRNTKNYYDDDYKNIVTDNQLKEIAMGTSKRDWIKLLLNLGFLEYDIEAYKAHNNNNAAATVYEMLQLWRSQETTLATKTRLKEYLKISGFRDLTFILD